jgi:hypothetical protein
MLVQGFFAWYFEEIGAIQRDEKRSAISELSTNPYLEANKLRVTNGFDPPSTFQ